VRFSTAELASQLQGELVGPDVTVDGASIDSRTIVAGQLFVPIEAARDGHDFIESALEAGAGAYLSARAPVGGTAIVVADTASALESLGKLARARLRGRVVGITGSVGKTTTKDLVRACFASTFTTSASIASFNNELGVPLTMLNAPDDAEWVVLEMGARGPGHIRALCDVVRPHVGIVTSVAMAHVEFFGDLGGVARAKGELVGALPPDGLAVLNVDDERVRAMADSSPCEVLGFGLGPDAAVRAGNVVLDGELRPRFSLHSPWGDTDVTLELRGAHQVSNALAAAAAALACGVPLDAVAGALGSVPAASLRMEVRRRQGRPVVLVDCYNANPASTASALRSLAALDAHRRVALLGVMAELGDETSAQHASLRALADGLGIEVVGYRTDLFGPSRVDDVDEAVALLRRLGPDDAALIKGSRVTRLEAVAAALDAAGPEAAVTAGA